MKHLIECARAIILMLLAMGFANYSYSQKPKSKISDFIYNLSDSALVEKSIFGRNDEIPFAFEGTIYHLPISSVRLPDLSKKQASGKIFTTKLRLPTTRFTEGFPGVTNRFEWFAIDYKGSFYIRQEGKYHFKIVSDDGSKVFINDSLLINNDGLHSAKAKFGSIELTKGFHKIEVQYFQGPRHHISLSLYVSTDSSNYKIFDMREFSPVGITYEENEIKINLGNEILFDFNKYAIKPNSKEIFKELKNHFFDKLDSLPIIIEGHTDDIGSEKYNQTLSLNRAQAVKNFFVKLGVNPNRITIVGYGEKKAKFPNNNALNRNKNRRVEILIREK